jgi:tRNA (cytidine/uridine-2'-O-)-methyltransferase
MDIALYQPDQPPNTGTLLRLGACMGVPVHIIEPCGFPFSPKAIKRYAMDYADHVEMRHHLDWASFQNWHQISRRRLVLLTTQSSTVYSDFTFRSDDILMVGSESAGVPADVHTYSDKRVTVPMKAEVRSLNIAVALSMVLGEGLRQTNMFPKATKVTD